MIDNLPKGKVLFAMPYKAKWYSKLIRIPVIYLHGKHSLIAKIKQRDKRIFMTEWSKFSDYNMRQIKERYSPENFKLTMEILSKPIS